MEKIAFAPRLTQQTVDTLTKFLAGLAQGVLIAVCGLIPILFIPGVYASLGLTKVFIVIVALLVSLVCGSLAVLRSGTFNLTFPLPLTFFAAFVLSAIASAYLSGDTKDALLGTILEVQTAGFFIVLLLLMVAALTLRSAKQNIIRLGQIMLLATGILFVVQWVRLWNPNILSFGFLSGPTASLIGSFNDLALLSGAVLLATLVYLQVRSAGRVGQSIALFFVLSSLSFLAIINFYAIWIALGFASLLSLLHLITRDTWRSGTEVTAKPVSRFTLSVVAVVCVVSGAFIVAGDGLQNIVATATGVEYVEVRPSLDTTIGIAKKVYATDALFGIGPNRFEDAWRLYKDPVINSTPFWNTDFVAGSGFVPTLFVTTGIAGGVFFLLFALSLLRVTYQVFMCRITSDPQWFSLAATAFAVMLFLWLMSFLYVPGVGIMMLTALATGVALAAANALKVTKTIEVNVVKERQYGLLLIAVVLVIIIASTMTVIGVSKQFVANVSYAAALDTYAKEPFETAYATIDQQLSRSATLFPSDFYFSERAQLRLGELRRLNATDPASVNPQRYAALLQEGALFTNEAIALDPTYPYHYSLLSEFFKFLNPDQMVGVREQNENLYLQAKAFNPQNPRIAVDYAQYGVLLSDLPLVREQLGNALRLKPDYTDALFLLSQLDVEEGNTEAAIATTQAIITLEPNNPARYFQLGVLHLAMADTPAALAAFSQAIALDPNYANARYFRAVTLLESKQSEAALIDLREVAKTNPDNMTVTTLIDQVSNGTYVPTVASPESVPFTDETGVTETEGVTTAEEVPVTDLITSPNRIGSDDTEQASTTETQ